MISETVASREAALVGRLNYLNAGSGVAAVRVYGGARPASAAESPTSEMLVSVPLANPAGEVGGGHLVLHPEEPGMIVSSGIATWARVVTRSGAVAFDMDAGPPDSGAECILSQDTLFAGGQVTITSAVLA